MQNKLTNGCTEGVEMRSRTTWASQRQRERKIKMYKKGVESFPYYLGIRSLREIATQDDRVCVLNILGGESRQVTPTSHAFSGGNVVFGTAPGKAGNLLKTPIGEIPVYNNVLEGMKAGTSSMWALYIFHLQGVRDGQLS